MNKNYNKTYMQPDVQVVELQTNAIMQVASGDYVQDVSNEEGLTPGGGSGDPDRSRRGRDIWEDDVDEEY
ncbi:MAG: hypothetical protein IJV45_00525 [Prevotella sp.]|nr:hypothetical protein [Prevotella sp.]